MTADGPQQSEKDDAETAAQSAQTEEGLSHTFRNIGAFQTRTGKGFYTRSMSAWTNDIPRTEHNQLFLDSDYGSTTLGPISDWCPALRMYASMVFSDSRGACVYWGPDMIAFYNEKFSVSCGSAHPFLMGRGFRDAFPTLWEQVMPMFDQTIATGQAVNLDNLLVFVLKDGLSQEMYFVANIHPLRGPSGEFEGVYTTYTESTATVLHERRRRVVERIAAIAPHSVEETLELIMEALRDNPHDITMAMIYAYDEGKEDDDLDLRLCCSTGVPDGHQCAPRTASLRNSQAGLIPCFRRVQLSKRPFVLCAEAWQLTGSMQDMFDGIQWSGHGEPARNVVVVPLFSGNTALGFIVQGTNPRRPYENITEMSIIDAARQIEAKWVASQSWEHAKLREQALERRATDYENRLRHMARSAPLGMCQITPDMKVQWANDQYYDITGHDRANPDLEGFYELVAPEALAEALEGLRAIVEGSSYVTQEVRLKRIWTPPVVENDESEQIHAWILTQGFPIMENGKMKMIMGYISDISHQKWAENVQMRNAAAATLAKRRQEEFIDTTSHEMRNPLTAITQLAEGISQSLGRTLPDTASAIRKIVEENVDAANTILACAAHQKRVIDDVLILSRLESQMLSITPVTERVSRIVTDTIKMFSGEVMLNGTDIEAVRDDSFGNLEIDYVLVDTSRLMQVLINLISNAIKFTSTQDVRKISIIYGAQTRRPPRITSLFGELFWTTSNDSDASNDALPPLQPGEDRLYLYFCVQDTGTGMTNDEMKRLFKRFSQATKKTHIAYGGSGLGLYICRELAEKQGGSVGVASSSGEGSVFAFYIETRAAQAPAGSLGVEGDSLPPESLKGMQGRSYLPRRMSSSTAVTTLAVRTEESSPPTDRRTEARSSPSPQRPQFRILLVEDNLVNQKVLAKQLRTANCTVAVANHGAEALEILGRAGHCPKPGSDDGCDIDVVLMDWEMPVMNGLDCCTEIRKRESEHRTQKRLPVIAITANVRQEQKDQAMGAGMDHVLAKPFTVRDLVEKMGEILGQTKPGSRSEDDEGKTPAT